MERSRSPAPLVPIVAGYAGLLWVWDFQARPVPFLLLVGGTFAAVGWFYRFALSSRSARGGAEIPLSTLLAVAALVRCLLLPVPPSLSDDIYRYLWDGRVTGAGFDPYRLAPDDPALEPLRDEGWELTAHREVETVYPPLAIALFSLAAALPGEVLVWKGVVALFDLGCCWLLWRLARRTGRPTLRVIWYAWNPLAVIESAGMGHVDAVGVCALLAAVFWLLPRRGSADAAHDERRALGPALAGVLAGAGVLVKLVPLVLLPLYSLRARSAAFAAALAVTVVVGLAPMVLPSQGPPPGLVRYGVSWEFNGLVFEPLWRTIERAEVVADVKATLDAVRVRVPRSDAALGLYPYVYPQFLAKVVLLVGLGWVVLVGLGVRDPIDATGWTLGGATLFSATCYPWYFLWALPFAALRASPAWLALSLSLQAAYLPRLLGWGQWPATWLAVWAPFLLVAAGSVLRTARAASARSSAGTSA
jgi:hypothetical protein